MKTEMTYDRACEILGFTTPKGFKANAALAESALRSMTSRTPLRYKVACKILIDTAK